MIILPLNKMATKCTVEDCEKLYDSGDKWRVSLVFGLVFMLFSSPFLYQMMAKLGGSSIASITGCPTLLGLLITTILFVLVIRLLMG